MQYNKLYLGLQLLTICTLCVTGMKNARNVYKKSFLCYKHSRLKQKERREQRNNCNRYNCMMYIGKEWATLMVTFLWSCSCNCVCIATLIRYSHSCRLYLLTCSCMWETASLEPVLSLYSSQLHMCTISPPDDCHLFYP